MLLSQINLQFEVIPSHIDEVVDPALTPTELAAGLAMQKAEAVAATIESGLIIGSDTIVVLDGEVLGKPADRDDAVAMLGRLSGQTHTVVSGVAIILKGSEARSTSFFVETKVTFGNLSLPEIEDYVDTGSPMDKAGSYGIQDDWGSVFVKQIDGDYYNVVGFPLFTFYQTLKTFAPEFLPRAVEPAKPAV